MHGHETNHPALHLRHRPTPRRYIIPLFIYSAANKSKRPPGYLLEAMGVEIPEGAAASLSRYAAQVVNES